MADFTDSWVLDVCDGKTGNTRTPPIAIAARGWETGQITVSAHEGDIAGAIGVFEVSADLLKWKTINSTLGEVTQLTGEDTCQKLTLENFGYFRVNYGAGLNASAKAKARVTVTLRKVASDGVAAGGVVGGGGGGGVVVKP